MVGAPADAGVESHAQGWLVLVEHGVAVIADAYGRLQALIEAAEPIDFLCNLAVVRDGHAV